MGWVLRTSVKFLPRWHNLSLNYSPRSELVVTALRHYLLFSCPYFISLRELRKATKTREGFLPQTEPRRSRLGRRMGECRDKGDTRCGREGGNWGWMKHRDTPERLESAIIILLWRHNSRIMKHASHRVYCRISNLVNTKQSCWKMTLKQFVSWSIKGDLGASIKTLILKQLQT